MSSVEPPTAVVRAHTVELQPIERCGLCFTRLLPELSVFEDRLQCRTLCVRCGRIESERRSGIRFIRRWEGP